MVQVRGLAGGWWGSLSEDHSCDRCEEVWVVLVTTLEGLLADSNVFFEENWNMCMKASMVEKILMAEKVGPTHTLNSNRRMAAI